jgi:hypothetical protein
MSKDERKEIWDDGLHFTAAGYARIGTLVAERLVEILQREAELRDGENQDQDQDQDQDQIKDQTA